MCGNVRRQREYEKRTHRGYNLSHHFARESLMTRHLFALCALFALFDAIAQGTYNFLDQSANSQAAIDQVFPENKSRKTSKLWQVQGALAKDLIELPGGMLNVAVGAQYRHEALNNPSSNGPNDVNPYARYYTINAVGVKGSRNVWSLSYEISAPILDTLRVKASGGYDHYSTGQKAFSPKFEAEWRIVNELKLRGTMSRGFRAPNFNESFQLPGTGYAGAQINCGNPIYATFCASSLHVEGLSIHSGRQTGHLLRRLMNTRNEMTTFGSEEHLRIVEHADFP